MPKTELLALTAFRKPGRHFYSDFDDDDDDATAHFQSDSEGEDWEAGRTLVPAENDAELALVCAIWPCLTKHETDNSDWKWRPNGLLQMN
jgi:hypothetical protein